MRAGSCLVCVGWVFCLIVVFRFLFGWYCVLYVAFVLLLVVIVGGSTLAHVVGGVAVSSGAG